MLAGLRVCGETRAPTFVRHVFLHHNGVSTGRQRRAGENAHGRASGQLLRGATATGLTHHRQHEVVRSKIAAVERITVHRRIIERRVVHVRVQRGGDIAAMGARQRQHLGARGRLDARENSGLGLGE